MNNEESWERKNIEGKSVHPTSVCIFCEFCTIDKDSENWKYVVGPNLLCKKHPTQRTIDPLLGLPIYAYWKKDLMTEPILEITEEKYRQCYYFNMDGKCSDFRKIDKKEEQKREMLEDRK